MRFANVVGSLVSGIVLSGLAAACSAPEHVDGPGDAGVAVNPLSAIAPDANALPESVADPFRMNVAVEQCDKTATVEGLNRAVAVHAYPGKSRAELAAVRVIAHASAQYVVDGTSFTDYVASAYIRDGAAMVECGTPGALPFDRVTFVLPK